jgi:hypothetical protein
MISLSPLVSRASFLRNKDAQTSALKTGMPANVSKNQRNGGELSLIIDALTNRSPQLILHHIGIMEDALQQLGVRLDVIDYPLPAVDQLVEPNNEEVSKLLEPKRIVPENQEADTPQAVYSTGGYEEVHEESEASEIKPQVIILKPEGDNQVTSLISVLASSVRYYKSLTGLPDEELPPFIQSALQVIKEEHEWDDTLLAPNGVGQKINAELKKCLKALGFQGSWFMFIDAERKALRLTANSAASSQKTEDNKRLLQIERALQDHYKARPEDQHPTDNVSRFKFSVVPHTEFTCYEQQEMCADTFMHPSGEKRTRLNNVLSFISKRLPKKEKPPSDPVQDFVNAVDTLILKPSEKQ